MTITLSSSFVVEKDEIYATKDGTSVFYFYSFGGSIEFINYGTISSSGGQNATAINSYVSSGVIRNQGLVSAESSGTSYAFYSPQWSAGIVNNGKVYAKGDSAYGLYTWSSGQTFENHGQVEIIGGSRAEGLHLVNGGRVINDGAISAVASGAATGIFIDRFEYDSFTNDGTITATSTGGGTSIGLTVQGLSSQVSTPNIINNGTITGTYAILVGEGGYSPPQETVEYVLNNNTLNGSVSLGAGGDTLVNSGVIRGNVLMGDGNDVVQLSVGAVFGYVDMGAGDDSATGGARDDDIRGGIGRDLLSGDGGNDSLDGGAGSDTLYGGQGDDRVTGDTGGDLILGENGQDQIYGGTGDDSIDAGAGDDVVSGDDGQDTIRGGDGFDQINGNMGDDTAYGGEGVDWVVGGKDQDLLYGDSGDDVVNGNLGNDTCYGGDGADWVRGGQGDDVVDGGAGNDWLSGDRGADTLTGGAGADRFYFFAGAAIDRVTDFSSAAGDRVLLDAGQTYTLSYTSEGAVIDLGRGDQMILMGVTAATLGVWLQA